MAETFGQALRRWRETAGMSQRELARRVPISAASVCRYEKDLQQVDVTIADRLDEAVGAGGTLRARLPPVATSVLDPDERERLRHNLIHPSRLDGQAVSALGQVLAAQRRLDDQLGPDPIIPVTTAQMTLVTDLLRDARGRHRDELALVAAEYVQFGGWLHAEARHDSEAVRLLTEAEELADEAEDGTLAAQAANFKGYLARQREQPRAVVRWFLAAHHTPGAHLAQRIGDAAQAAQGYATLGEGDEARRLLDVACALLDPASRDQPPGTAYWLTPTFHRLNIGLAHLALEEHATAADHIRAGLAALPDDQLGAAWAVEYQNALSRAEEAA